MPEIISTIVHGTAGVREALILRPVVRGGGTPTDGIGTSIDFEIPDDATPSVYKKMGLVEFISTDVSAGTEDGYFNHKVMVAGLPTSIVRVKSDGVRLYDNMGLHLGDADDVKFVWDATNLVITPVVDDTGQIRFGNGTLDMDVRMTLGVAADYFQFDVGAKSLIMAGDARIDLSSATGLAANTDGCIIKAGTSAAKVTENTANMKFMSFYFEDGASSGSAEGLYCRLYAAGTLGTAQAARLFTSITDVAVGTARGAHISLSFGTSGRITGLGAAMDATLHVPSTALPAVGGTYAVISADVNSDAASADPSNAVEFSVFRCALQGTDGGAFARIDLKADLINLDGWTAAADTTKMISSVSLAELPASTIGIRVHYNGNKYYIPAVIAAQWN